MRVWIVGLRRSGGVLAPKFACVCWLGSILDPLLCELGGDGGGELELLVVDKSGPRVNTAVTITTALLIVTHRLTVGSEYAILVNSFYHQQASCKSIRGSERCQRKRAAPYYFLERKERASSRHFRIVQFGKPTVLAFTKMTVTSGRSYSQSITSCIPQSSCSQWAMIDGLPSHVALSMFSSAISPRKYAKGFPVCCLSPCTPSNGRRASAFALVVSLSMIRLLGVCTPAAIDITLHSVEELTWKNSFKSLSCFGLTRIWRESALSSTP